MLFNRSFLKWPGNKYRCLKHILPLCPPARRWVEPFLGSGVVFLNTDYPAYILSEVNQDVIELFHYLQVEGTSFIATCLALFCPENNNKATYYALREQFNLLAFGRERAALFLYLNRHGYNGLCRYNLSGKYNVPFGSYTKPYFPLAEMENFCIKSQRAKFVHSDFRATFAQAEPGDLIYCDPPYAPLMQGSNFTAYASQRFTNSEQQELATLAEQCVAKGVTVIISNHDTPTTRQYYRHASHIEAFAVKREISCQVSQRRWVPELIAVYTQ